MSISFRRSGGGLSLGGPMLRKIDSAVVVPVYAIAETAFGINS